MSAAGWLDMNAALQNLDSPPESVKKARTKRRSSYAGRTTATAGVHGRGSIGTISSGIIKSFRERFLSNSSGDSGKYRKLRQRDAESGRMEASGSSSSGENEDPSSSSSVEDLFANEAERRNWHRKTSEKRRRNARKKVSGLDFYDIKHFIMITFHLTDYINQYVSIILIIYSLMELLRWVLKAWLKRKLSLTALHFDIAVS